MIYALSEAPSYSQEGQPKAMLSWKALEENVIVPTRTDGPFKDSLGFHFHLGSTVHATQFNASHHINNDFRWGRSKEIFPNTEKESYCTFL